MTGKQLLKKVFNKEETSRVPWVPFAGVHAGSLKGYSAEEVLKDSNKLLSSLEEVKKLYNPDGMPIIFDLQIEAEILDCELKWGKDSPPTVISHPLADSTEIPDKIPGKDEGRIPLVLEVMQEFKKTAGEEVALYGLLCGPFTLASHLRGTALFTDMIDDSKYVEDLLAYTTEIAIKMASYYIEAGMDVIAVVDPMVSQISPVHFRQFLHSPFKSLFDYLASQGVSSSFFVCGDATKNIEEMCLTEPDCISVDENIDLKEAKKITDQHDIVIGGNIPLTTVMLLGNQQDNMKYVIDLLDTVSTENLILSPGCDMPYDVPPENVIAISQAVREVDQTREMIKKYEKKEIQIDVQLPDYDNLEKPLLEVFTLDSDTCAACTYMKEAALAAKDKYGDDIEINEYKYTSEKNIARMQKLGVKNLPSLYINGELKFSSLVPARDDLYEAIEEYVK